MEKEKIERAAIELCTTEGQEEWVKDYGVSCFKDGARWRINEAWHEASEKPKHGAACLVEVIIETAEENTNSIDYVESWYSKDFGWSTDYLSVLDDLENATYEIRKLAYIADLLPDTRKEAEP